MEMKIPPTGSPKVGSSEGSSKDNLDFSHLTKVTAKFFRDALQTDAQKKTEHAYTDQSVSAEPQEKNLAHHIAVTAKLLRDSIP